MVEIRLEKPEDIEKIRNINNLAFGQHQEGVAVDKIREKCQDIISLVAVDEGEVVGHIFFSPAIIEGEVKKVMGMGLAPMAVLPKYQRKGIGSQLVTEGIKRIKKAGYPFLIVLGHENYYPRFGFQRASAYGLKCQWQGVPDEAFMVMVFNIREIKDISGIARYRDEFNDAM